MLKVRHCLIGIVLALALLLHPRVDAVSPAAPKASAPVKRAVQRVPARKSEAQRTGLHRADDPLSLRSAAALVVDVDTNEVLLEKNSDAVLPIASITKLMTALVTVEAQLPLDEVLTVTRADRTIDRVRSRLSPGVRLTRGEALHVALMSSENHAAQLLGRTYPGGVAAFVDAMNAKALLLGMTGSRFVDPTGLSPENRSTPHDLVLLMQAAHDHALIREYSVSPGYALAIGKRQVRYGSTNGLIADPDWKLELQKTGYISAAGRCMVVQAVVEGRRIAMVLLDSVGKYSRLGDAERIRGYLATLPLLPRPPAVLRVSAPAAATNSVAAEAEPIDATGGALDER